MARCRRFVFLLIGVVTCVLIGLQVGLDGWAALQGHTKIHFKDHHKKDDVRVGVTSLRFAQVVTTNDPEYRNNSSNVRVVSNRPRSNDNDGRSTPLDAPATMGMRVTVTMETSKGNLSNPQQENIIIISERTVRQESKGVAQVIPVQQSMNLPKSLTRTGSGGILSPEQMLRILGNTIAALPVIPPAKVIRILIVTYFRSGSTFMGDVLQQNWKTFYHFEPLHYMSDGLRIKPNQTEEALSLLRDLFRCNFSAPLAPKYLKWAEDQKHMFLFKRNRFLWIACRMQPQTCFRPDFANYVCERAPVQVMKVTRLHMDHVKRLVEENPDLDLRVVHLIRDPRGTISSRKVLEWCNTTSCSDFRVLCNEMNADHDAFRKMSTLKENRFFQVRYEDMSLRPEPETKRLFSKLGLPYTSSIVKFLRINTRARPIDSKDPYSTRRDSSKTAFEWRKKILLPEIKKIQIGCARVLKSYQYGLVNNPKQLIGDPPLLPFKN